MFQQSVVLPVVTPKVVIKASGWPLKHCGQGFEKKSQMPAVTQNNLNDCRKALKMFEKFTNYRKSLRF